MGKVYRRVRGSAVLSLVTLTVLLGGSARAQTQVLDFTGGVSDVSTQNNTLGWGFNVTENVTVTQLGIFDELNDGLANSHQIGLWTNTGTLLTSGTIASGLSGTAESSASGFGSFRYIDAPSVVLTPGNYVIGASYAANDTDSFRRTVAGITTALGTSFIQSRTVTNTGFNFPLTTDGTASFFGPNIRVGTVTSAAPESSSLALVLVGLAGGVALRGKIKHKAGRGV